MLKERFAQDDPRFHTRNLKRLLSDVIEHARADVAKISDRKAQALFETAAEVLIGLRKAIEDFEQRGEAAWKQPR